MGGLYHVNRASPCLTGRGYYHVAPRWRPNLLFCADLLNMPQNIHIGAPGKTFVDSGPRGFSIQIVDDTNWKIGFDANGPFLRCTTNSNGANPSISALLSNVTPTATISFAVWYQPDAFGDYAMPLGRGVSAHAYYSGLALSTGDSYAGADRTSGGIVNVTDARAKHALGWWKHFGVSWDGALLRGYADGGQVQSVAAGSAPNTASNGIWVFPGGLADIGNTQKGASRYAMVWNDRVLTPQDFADLASQPSPFAEGPLNHSPLNVRPFG